MAHPPDLLGLLIEARDAINTEDAPVTHAPRNILGVLQNIRDLLNTGDAAIAPINHGITGVLKDIRDLLNTEDASVASYPPSQFGIWQSIIAFSNTEADPVDTTSIFTCIQSFRDLAVLGRIPAEGGGGAPEWVPENAVIHIDFVGGAPQGRAWTLADGVVAVSTLLGNTADADSGWGQATSYNSANLTANGYVSDTPIAITGAALTKLLTGSTCVITTYQVSGAVNYTLTLLAPDASAAVEFSHQPSNNLQISASSWNGPTYVEAENVLTLANGATNVMAFTYSSNRVEAAANGEAAIADTMDDPSEYAGLTAVVFDFAGAVGALQSITIYAALPDTTGLSALSAVA